MKKPNSDDPPIDPSSISGDLLAAHLGLRYNELARLASRVERHGYSRFEAIRGGRPRRFAEPAPWLKPIQRKLTDAVLSKLPKSDHVYSCAGRDVVRGAGQHVGSDRFMVVVDIRDCFPSTTLVMVREALQSFGFDPRVAALITRLVTSNGRLPQGPPSSPAVLNCVMHSIDEELGRLAAGYGAVYTRYMDDLCFSANVPLTGLLRRAKAILIEQGYEVSERKTRQFGLSDLRIVTNIVVGDDALDATPKYKHDVRKAIRDHAHSPSKESEASVWGQISWVGRLNDRSARHLAKQFSKASASK